MRWEKIKSIKKIENKICYDVSLKGERKGFLANGIQVHNSDFTIEDAFATFEDGRKFKRKYPEVADIASRMEGQTRGFGQHAAAIVISSENLKLGERGYLRRGKDEEPVINWDKYDIEHVGLMKLDILGLNALTVLDKTKKLVQKRRGIDIDWESLPLNDKKIFDEFTKGNNVGTFQVGCISGDTFVGIKEPKRIKDLQCGEITESIKDDGSIINNKIKRVFKTGTKEVKLINIGGIRLKATEDHKFLTETGWKRLKDICVGESVLTADIGYTYCPCGCGNKLTKRSASRNHPYHGWKLGHCGKNPSVSKKISESVKKVWEGDKYKENWVNKMREKEKDPDFLVNRNLLSKKARDNREYIQKASDAQKKLWSNEKYRVKQRKLCKYGFDNFILKGGMIGNTRGGGRGKHGKREDIGHYVRSTWEANYARILNLLGIKYEYEKDVFALSNGKTYRPDFKLSDKEYVEIKGYMDRASEEKLRLFKNEFPDIKLKLILGKEYEELKSKYKNMVDWENTETKFVPVLAIEEWGEVETWDMEMENSEAPSYVANGISVHNSLGLIKFCRELGIENFETLVHATALYRPGTLRSGMTSTFQLRKTGKEKFEYLNSYMESITKDTYGVILYQEQVMRFMYELGGLPWKTADTVRKVMSKTQGVDQFLKFRDMFAEGCEKRGTLDRKTAAKLWSELANFGSYGFNKSHAVEYSIITYWDQYCKVYFPEEFMCASLTYGSEDKKDLLVKEAIRLGIEVLPPKAGISKAKDWVVGDKKLYSPYIELKGFGPSTAAKCEDVLDKLERNGSVPEVKLSKKVLDALEAVGAFTDEELEYKKLDGLMTFSLNRDPAGEIRTIVETLKEHGLEVGNLSDIDFKVIDKKMVNYFGCLTEIKFGYRGKLDSYEKKIGASGLADNLGGVYGNFQDSTDFAMIVFSSEIYLKKKDRVEHCSGDFAVAKVNRPMRTTSIHCSEIWFDDELKRCEIGNMGIKAIKRKRSVINLDIQNCSDCSLRTECKSPVAPSKGIYNIAIIGEAPGSEEDEKGIPFCGKSGREVWKELEKCKMERSMFHVTNVVKCFPSKTKTPTKRQISSCSKWIDQELKEVNPIIMLAFGNTALRYFTEKESGIMDLSGTTEWSEKHKAWICWCIHPASVLYHRENYSLFESGIKNFCEKVKNLGF